MFVTRRRLYLVTAYSANDSFGLSGSVFVGSMLRKIFFISADRAFDPMSRRVFLPVAVSVSRRGNDYRLAYLVLSVFVRERFPAFGACPVRLRAVFNAGGLHSVRLDESVRGIFAVLEGLCSRLAAYAGLIIYRLCGAGRFAYEILRIRDFSVEYVRRNFQLHRSRKSPCPFLRRRMIYNTQPLRCR